MHSLLKTVLKDLNNETGGIKDLKYGTNIKKDKLLDKKKLKLTIKIRFSRILSLTCL